MPTIAVDKQALFEALGQTYTTEEFDELCFEFGIELDEDTTDHARPVVNGSQEPAQLKIEIPANRYDMLCFEGIQLMLNIFRGKASSPIYKTISPKDGRHTIVTCHEETSRIRPYVSGAILRNLKFTKSRYESFIALQDKLHQNLARQRTLVAIGTHDLDTVKAPFTYEALPPEQIQFVPLNQSKSLNGHELMSFYEKDRHLSRYLPIIRDSPVYPVILDANRTVCSMPPIINSNHSKITLDTKNVFIDITATDRTKAELVNNMIVCMFSQYTSEPFTIEPIEIISPHNGESRIVPDLAPRRTTASLSYINACCGLDLSAEKVCGLLERMSYHATPSPTSRDTLDISIPPTRADILHQADIMEDVAIAYGFNSLPREFPKVSATIAQPLPINKLSDIIRLEAAMAGWSEVMSLILCSHAENFAHLNRHDNGLTAVTLANPKTAEYQIVRTSLLPGLLKTMRENKHHSMPLRIFEVSDVALKAPDLERKSRNERHFAAAYIGKTSGFEIVHGLMDRVMLMLKSSFITRVIEPDDSSRKLPSSDDTPDKNQQASSKDMSRMEYWISELDNPTFFPGHAANIHLRVGDKEQIIGTFGILHPTVLEAFELKYPVSCLELNIEVFL